MEALGRQDDNPLDFRLDQGGFLLQRATTNAYICGNSGPRFWGVWQSMLHAERALCRCHLCSRMLAAGSMTSRLSSGGVMVVDTLDAGGISLKRVQWFKMVMCCTVLYCRVDRVEHIVRQGFISAWDWVVQCSLSVLNLVYHRITHNIMKLSNDALIHDSYVVCTRAAAGPYSRNIDPYSKNTPRQYSRKYAKILPVPDQTLYID